MSVALVTGASRGFGRALAVDLAKDGWSLVIDGRNVNALREVSETLVALGAEVRPILGDIADGRHRAALLNAVAELGGLDLLVNNASELGPSPLQRLDRCDLDDLRRVYEVNVVAPVAIVQLALPFLRLTGAIVAISSDAAIEAYPGWGGYGSSKAALDQVHRVLGSEHPELSVYGFDPGDMRTEMHQRATPSGDLSALPEPETVVPALRRLLSGRPPSGRYRACDWGV